jgi:hypothetical protein
LVWLLFSASSGAPSIGMGGGSSSDHCQLFFVMALSVHVSLIDATTTSVKDSEYFVNLFLVGGEQMKVDVEMEWQLPIAS